MLTPYVLADMIPFSTSGSKDWVSPTSKKCASTFTAWTPPTMTHEERVIKGAIDEVLHEMFRVLSDIWLDASGVEGASVEDTKVPFLRNRLVGLG